MPNLRRYDTSSTADAVPLEVNCREAAREATLGCPLKGEANPMFFVCRVNLLRIQSAERRGRRSLHGRQAVIGVGSVALDAPQILDF